MMQPSDVDGTVGADMFSELMEKSCKTGEGWNDNLFQAMLKMDDDTVQKMMDKMRFTL